MAVFITLRASTSFKMLFSVWMGKDERNFIVYLLCKLRWWSTKLVEEIVHDQQETTHYQRGQRYATPAIKVNQYKYKERMQVYVCIT